VNLGSGGTRSPTGPPRRPRCLRFRLAPAGRLPGRARRHVVPVGQDPAAQSAGLPVGPPRPSHLRRLPGPARVPARTQVRKVPGGGRSPRHDRPLRPGLVAISSPSERRQSAPCRQGPSKPRHSAPTSSSDVRSSPILLSEPTVSFKEGFGGVKLSSTRREGGSVALSASGAGTRRRITLATWEWTRKLLSRGDQAAGASSSRTTSPIRTSTTVTNGISST